MVVINSVQLNYSSSIITETVPLSQFSVNGNSSSDIPLTPDQAIIIISTSFYTPEVHVDFETYSESNTHIRVDPRAHYYVTSTVRVPVYATFLSNGTPVFQLVEDSHQDNPQYSNLEMIFYPASKITFDFNPN